MSDPDPVSIRDYLREEGITWYVKDAGLWMPVGFSVVGNIAAPWIADARIEPLANGMAAASGGTLAILLALVTYQLSALTVDDYRHFIHSDMARRDFQMILAGVKWGALMSAVWTVVAVLLLVFKPAVRLRLGLFAFGASASHLWAGILASFDFAQIKIAIAATLEQEADKKRATENKLNP